MDEKFIEQMREAIVQGQVGEVTTMTNKALETMAPLDIVTKIVAPAMGRVGDLYSCGEFYVPEMLLAARAAKAALGIVRPMLAKGNVKPMATVVIGTVRGDLHDIGKNLVSMMLEGAGFQVIDLGIDVPPEKFIQAVLENKADLMGMSALISTTMPQMGVTIKEMEKAGVRNQVKVIVGGAPVTDDYAKSIGADGFAPDAAQAVTVSKRLLGLN
jgi:5-methyltetrahydrofolate--homocysteine methyltransferase